MLGNGMQPVSHTNTYLFVMGDGGVFESLCFQYTMSPIIEHDIGVNNIDVGFHDWS